MVLQKNVKDGVIFFNKQWKDYEERFGDFTSTKFWYGRKALYTDRSVGVEG